MEPICIHELGTHIYIYGTSAIFEGPVTINGTVVDELPGEGRITFVSRLVRLAEGIVLNGCVLAIPKSETEKIKKLKRKF